jgi:hypothetical protein
MDLLRSLSVDESAEVRSVAEDILLGALHPLIDDHFSGEDLADALVELRGDALRRLRSDIEHLLSLSERFPRDNHELLVAKLRELQVRLPNPSIFENLTILLHLNRWDFQNDELGTRFAETLSEIDSEEERSYVLEMLSEKDLPAAWELGRSLASLNWEGSLDVLLANFGSNSPALVGYLSGLTDQGILSAFDDFLESDFAQRLTLVQRVRIAVSGPNTERARDSIKRALDELPVDAGARSIFGWQRANGAEDVVRLLDLWIPHMSTQSDYNSVVDWLNLWIHPSNEIPPEMLSQVFHLVMLREQFPELGQKEWAWAQMAAREVNVHAFEIAVMLLNLMESGEFTTFGMDESAAVLRACCVTQPDKIWNEIGNRLSQNSWRIQMDIRSWLLPSIPPKLVEGWIGDDVERGRTVASIAPLGDDAPTELTRYLLDKFGDDEKVSASFAVTLVSGSWVGPESSRIAGQIQRLTGWRHDNDEPVGVRTWARKMIPKLEQRRTAALEREAEMGY